MAIANVLLVDDEAPFVETMTKRLTKRKLEVKTALNGPEALKALEKRPQRRSGYPGCQDARHGWC